MSELLERTSSPEEIKISFLQRIKQKIIDVLLYPFYVSYKWYLWRQISQNKMQTPKHIGIILDGNRRFSRAHGLEIWAGHKLGARKVEEVLGYLWELGVRILTLYVFSIENFNRSQEEVDHIMKLAEQKFTELLTHPLIYKYKVRIRAIGRKQMLPSGVQEAIGKLEEATKDFHDYFLNVAIAYGGRAEIIDAIKKMVKQEDVENITEEIFEKYLYTAGLPNPDLIIRTSGEVRISGFLLWQAAYSELYFADIYWPEIRKIDIWRAIRAYQHRQRRFGQ
ncbi:MAG: di-trans,poly-cis-decaprenylcistransferase [Promethearchaeota archaeon]|nr:MAG: di-trans,poly-cis-decaprenylcistransferase [Candidatus Lokiarchaeota archaeon]